MKKKNVKSFIPAMLLNTNIHDCGGKPIFKKINPDQEDWAKSGKWMAEVKRLIKVGRMEGVDFVYVVFKNSNLQECGVHYETALYCGMIEFYNK